MSGECEDCGEHSLYCQCDDECLTCEEPINFCKCRKTPSKLQKLKDSGLLGGLNNWKNIMQIEEEDLLEFIHWSRRYCDGRSTYAPSRFNRLYDKIVQMNPTISIKEKDQFDHTLKDKGKYWPYAQDGMFDEKTGSYEARPLKTMEVKGNENDEKILRGMFLDFVQELSRNGITKDEKTVADALAVIDKFISQNRDNVWKEKREKLIKLTNSWLEEDIDEEIVE